MPISDERDTAALEGPPDAAPTKGPVFSSRAPTLVSADGDLAERARARGLRVAAITIVSLAVVLVVAVVAVAVAIRARGSVQAEVSLDGQGNELLNLKCTRCQDGTVVNLGSAEATFRNHSAAVPVNAGLAVGDNNLTVTLRHPDARSEDVDLLVAVDYHLSTSLDGLADDPPVVRVHVAAKPDTAAVVDGKPVELDASGQGVAEVNVSQYLTGAATSVARLDRAIPYTITPQDAQPEDGKLKVRIGIVPLVIDAPGASITIDSANFWLAGRTMKTGTISVSGRPITVDPEGRFAQLMNVSSVGETTIFIRGEAPDYAPRLVPLRVRRVEDLRKEAKNLGSKATRSYATITENLGSKQAWEVMLVGTITEVRTTNHTTVFLLDIRSGCSRPPCLARADLGAKLAASKGDVVTVFGKVDGAVEFKGQRIPEIRSEFVVKGIVP